MEIGELIEDQSGRQYLDDMSDQLYERYSNIEKSNDIKKINDKINKINTGFFKNVFTEDEINELLDIFKPDISYEQFSDSLKNNKK
jgi:uncharacterized protein YfkK (UPF0435 family)